LLGKINLLVLNAGIGLQGSWEDSSYFHKIMDVNLFGVIHGLNTLLPLITESSSASTPASIVITGSKQGITNPPGNPAYNASKAAVKALAEHLSFDLSKSSPATSVSQVLGATCYVSCYLMSNGVVTPDTCKCFRTREVLRGRIFCSFSFS
jgi:NAD(P)-dependent dehydrogenase (short-subunit alcohol dehydrogenase family)